MASLTVHLDDYTEVTLFADGSASVDLSGMRAARHEVCGRISVYPDGAVKTWRCEDGTVTTPLPAHVVRAAENAARRQAARAKRAARGVLKAHARRMADDHKPEESGS